MDGVELLLSNQPVVDALNRCSLHVSTSPTKPTVCVSFSNTKQSVVLLRNVTVGRRCAASPFIVCVRVVVCVCDCQSGWYQPGALCRKVDLNGFAGCPYMFSNSAVCLTDTTNRPGCAGYFQSTYEGKFRVYAYVAVGVAFIEVWHGGARLGTVDEGRRRMGSGDCGTSWEAHDVHGTAQQRVRRVCDPGHKTNTAKMSCQ